MPRIYHVPEPSALELMAWATVGLPICKRCGDAPVKRLPSGVTFEYCARCLNDLIDMAFKPLEGK